MQQISRNKSLKIIYIFILCFSLALADFIFTQPDPGLYVKSAKTYDGLSILLHMEKQKPSDDVSLGDHFIIRILDSNFEINRIEIFDEEIKEAEDIFILTDEYILLAYYKINDKNRYGMIYNRNGKILSK